MLREEQALFESARRLATELRGVPVELATEPVRHAADGIVAFAARTGCDLLVIGTHGRRGLGRAFLGSVAEKVVRLAPCSVLVVRTPRSLLQDEGGDAA